MIAAPSRELGETGEVCLNGAAAHLVAIGDVVIVVAYAEVEQSELDRFVPRIVHVDTSNRILADLALQRA